MNRSSQLPCHPRLGRSVLPLLIVLAVILLVLLPIAGAEYRNEVARWCWAAAEELWLDGEPDAAIAKMDEAIEWSPKNAALYNRRAIFKTAIGQWADGLADYDRALEIQPNQRPEGDNSISIHEQRATCLLHLGRFDEAIDVWKRLLREETDAGVRRRARYLGGLAETYAFAEMELDEGLALVNEAMEINLNQVARLDPAGLLYFARGCTAVDRGDLGLALASLNEAAEQTAKLHDLSVNRATLLAFIPRLSTFYEQQARDLLPHFLGILSQRADLMDELEEAEQAERDRKRIDQLRPKGGSSIGQPITLADAINLVSSTAELMATRGILYRQLGDLSDAQYDLHQALNCYEWAARAYEWHIEADKYRVLDLRPMLIDRGYRAKRVTVIREQKEAVDELRAAEKKATAEAVAEFKGRSSS